MTVMTFFLTDSKKQEAQDAVHGHAGKATGLVGRQKEGEESQAESLYCVVHGKEGVKQAMKAKEISDWIVQSFQWKVPGCSVPGLGVVRARRKTWLSGWVLDASVCFARCALQPVFATSES